MRETKICRDCGEEKPLSEFYRNFRYKNGNWYYRAECKLCYRPKRNEHDKERRHTDEAYNEKLRAAYRQRYAASPEMRARAKERKQAWLARQGTPTK